MRIPSSILARISTGLLGSIIEPGETELIVPNVVQPVLLLTRPLIRGTGVASTDQVEDSIDFATNIINPASTASSTSKICTLKKGLWFVTYRLMYHGDFLGAPNIANKPQLNVASPADDINTLIVFAALQNLHQEGYGQGFFLFDADGWYFRIVAPATGVGQTNITTGICHASRLQ